MFGAPCNAMKVKCIMNCVSWRMNRGDCITMKNRIAKVPVYGTALALIVCVTLLALWQFGVGYREKRYTIGVAQWITNPEYTRNIEGFKAELARRGFTENKNVRYLFEIANADKTIQQGIMKKFQKAHVDLVYSLTTPGTLVAKSVLAKIPIVFSIVTYPVETGVIKSLANSGCNAVGTRNYMSPSRQFYVFERICPSVRRIAFVHRAGEPNSTIQLAEFKSMFSLRGIEVVDVAATDCDDLRRKLISVIPSVDAVYSACDTLIQSGGEEIVIMVCKEHAKPGFSCNKDGVIKGALVGNVADFADIGRIAGEKSAQILSGVSPQWLRTESPRQDYVIVNAKTAAELHFSIPDDILGMANEVIK
jgi:putative tryptophan/tyrosine transport system substrate-binding protein